MANYPELSVIPLICGCLYMERWRFSGTDKDRILELPVFAFLVPHPQGCVLFDTGLPIKLWTDQSTLELTPGLTATKGKSNGLAEEIKAAGYSLQDISVVINSHCHRDHMGGNSLFPETQIYQFSDNELNKDKELFNDGSIVLLATPGHSDDHISMLVRGRKRQALLTGDACFRPGNLSDHTLPLILDDKRKAQQSISRLSSISASKYTLVLTSHDPTANGKPIVL